MCSGKVVEILNAEEISLTAASEEKQETESESAYNSLIIAVPMEGYSSRTKQWRNTKPSTKSTKGLGYEEKKHAFLAILTETARKSCCGLQSYFVPL